jgi:hypothetical protein
MSFAGADVGRPPRLASSVGRVTLHVGSKRQLKVNCIFNIDFMLLQYCTTSIPLLTSTMLVFFGTAKSP